MNYYLQLGVLTATTVLKLMFAIVMGFVIMPYFNKPEETLSGLSYIAVRIFLPCILGPRLLMNVTWHVILKYYWAPVLICVPIFTGLMCSFVVHLFIRKEYCGILVFMCVCHDGLTFPLGLVLTVKGLSWLTPEAVLNAQTYVFLCNFVCSIAVWAFGDPWITYCSRKENLENLAHSESWSHNQNRATIVENDLNKNNNVNYKNGQSDKFIDTVSTSASSRTYSISMHDELHNVDSANHYLEPIAQLERYEVAHEKDEPIRMRGKEIFLPPTITSNASAEVSQSPLFATENLFIRQEWERRHRSMFESVAKLSKRVWRIIRSPPLFSSIIGLTFALTPPLHALTLTSLGKQVVGGLAFLGDAAIPITLFVLGCVIANNRRANKSAKHTTQQATSHEELTVDALHNNTWKGMVFMKLFSCFVKLRSIFTPECVFILLTLTARLIIIPAVSLLVIHLLASVGFIPTDKPFLFAVLLETCSPSPNNVPLICIMHNYHTKVCAKLTFVMYLVCSVTIAIWLFVYILYLGQ